MCTCSGTWVTDMVQRIYLLTASLVTRGGLLIRYTIPLIAFIWVYMAHIATENFLCSVIATYWKQEAASSSLVRLKGEVTNINIF